MFVLSLKLLMALHLPELFPPFLAVIQVVVFALSLGEQHDPVGERLASKPLPIVSPAGFCGIDRRCSAETGSPISILMAASSTSFF